MNKIFLILLVLFAFVISGCDDNKKSDTDAISGFLTKMETVQFSNQKFPEWFLIKIGEFENTWESSLSKVKIFYGEWSSQYVYFIKDNLRSCLMCEIYHEEGGKIVLNEKTIEDFCTKSHNWKLVYKFGTGICL